MDTTPSGTFTNSLPSSQLKQRRPTAVNNWRAPGESTPKSIISSRWGPKITDDALVTFAFANARLDRYVLATVNKVYEFELPEPQNPSEVAFQVQRRHDKADIDMIISQFKAIENGDADFAIPYLVDRHLLYYWQETLSYLILYLRQGKNFINYEQSRKVTEGFLRRADQWSVEIINIAEKDLLTPESRSILGEKWDKLDQLCDVYYLENHANLPRTLKTWSTLSKQIYKPAKISASTQSITNLPTAFWPASSLLWLTFAGTVLTNIPTFALAYSYSTHKPGTVRDADFWFLMQASLSQGFGLTTACFPLWKASKVPKWSWIPPMTVSLLCVVLAPYLYTVAPTEWSSFLALIATAMQGFVALQFALIGG